MCESLLSGSSLLVKERKRKEMTQWFIFLLGNKTKYLHSSRLKNQYMPLFIMIIIKNLFSIYFLFKTQGAMSWPMSIWSVQV